MLNEDQKILNKFQVNNGKICDRWLIFLKKFYKYKLKFKYLGKANCPYFAKAELLGDELALNLPGFKIHKIPVDPDHWDVSL